MKTTTQINQIAFNVTELTWSVYLFIRGCTVTLSITAIEAENLLNAIKEDDTDRITIEATKDFIYYILN